MSLGPPPTGLQETRTARDEAAPPFGEHLLLVRISGDISTKAPQTRHRFCRHLARNLDEALIAAGIAHRIRREHLRFFVETEDPRAAEIACRVFGVQSVSVSTAHPWTSMETLVQAGEEKFRDHVTGRTFAVRVRRTGQVDAIPFRSLDVARELGRRLLPYSRGVDLGHPEAVAHIEIHEREAYFFREKRLGYGGLPVGVEGRALALVSGGFDSAVAAWLMLKRGVALDYVFFNLGGSAHRRGVLAVTRTLAERWSAGDHPTLHEIDFAPLVTALQEHVEPSYWQLVLKRRMLQAASHLATQLERPALVTGEALGQVSSQTLLNLAVLSQDVETPVLRPLLGFNKDEIIRLAEEIGTAPASAAVQEYCALLPHHPETRAARKALADEDAKLDPGLLEETLRGRVVHDVKDLSEAAEGESFTIDRAEPEMTVLDMRPRDAYKKGHHHGALHLDYAHALRSYLAFDKTQIYALYCDVGLKSAHLAEVMREAGFSAFQLRGAPPESRVSRRGRKE